MKPQLKQKFYSMITGQCNSKKNPDAVETKKVSRKSRKIAPFQFLNTLDVKDVTLQPKSGGHDGRIVTYEKDSSIKPTRSCGDSTTTDHSTDRRHSFVSQLSQHPNNPLVEEKEDVDIFQKYEVLPTITGHGVAGSVRPAYNRQTNELCAVKTIHKSKVKRADRVRREVAFLGQVRHPNVIRAYDVYEDDRYVHIVTEMCHGGELFDRIVQKSEESGGLRCFDERGAASVVKSLLSAVSYLHEMDIIHRDLKPENILFSTKEDDSPIKLIDFGLSIRHTKDQSPLTNMVGTAYYMAPELLRGCYDRACDLWSVGVITYIMLCGKPPFNDRNDENIFKKIRRGDEVVFVAPAWSNISDFAKHFITCLICHDRSKRWTADMALQHPWLRNV